ncbi:DUF5025 domain-containing protein [Tenacibaculum agarivorans]|uniref:DUF5025 domain-containing protein n=1 Tax=Tenacibaculum agarivorans TaxID=1908389 RepID=UPI00094B9461|nr:DUF5025 domain-containing protein [Tenacibaculum agarivorans]
MKNNLLLIVSTLLLILSGCNDNENSNSIEKLNEFKMLVDDELWLPSQIDKDFCMHTFSCSRSEIDGKPLYTIKAYRDSNLITDLTSENFFHMQIMNVNSIGKYSISDAEGHFKNYAKFFINKDGKRKFYRNSTNNDFEVEILEFFPKEISFLTGIRGKFSGKLYNVEDKNDFIEITNATFSFKKTNTTTFNQCNND